MDTLRAKAKELLESGRVAAVVGLEAGTGGQPRPCFVRGAEDLGRLVDAPACAANLAAYVTRKEVKRLGRLALVAGPAELRALLQLWNEHQLGEGAVLALARREGEVLVLEDAEAVETFLATTPRGLSAPDTALLAELQAMDREARWAYWRKELDRCVKCYACRNACPMCYCAQCTMDCNRPQWVPVAAHPLGNQEYHLVRAMHLAGRCVQCGACGAACPLDIPVHLLSIFAESRVHAAFGTHAGEHAGSDYALSSFRPDDPAPFIR
jgi:ferredoxin